MVSSIIPSRSPQWLKQTVQDLLDKAEGEVEVIVVYDGRWPEPNEMPPEDPRVVQIFHGEIANNKGMRDSINAGVLASKGDYLMVIDEQCGVDQGYDVKLAADCEDDWVVIPRRWRLDAENWGLTKDTEGDKRPPVDYMYVEYPYVKPYDKTQGLHGAIWDRPGREDILIDDTPTMQGSCYFMSRKHWDKVIKRLDSTYYGPFTMEAQEVSMKTWFTGGRVVVNKKTWYAHWHKGKKGKGYAFTNAQYRQHQEGMEKGRLYAIDYWLNTNNFPGYDWDWFVTEKFPDMPGWSPDWKQRIEADKGKDYSALGYKDDEWLSGLRPEDKPKVTEGKTMKTRRDLANYFNELGFKKGAEVGVFAGLFSEHLLKTIPGLDLTCVDIWGTGKYKAAEDECLERLAPYGVTIIKDYSVEAAKQIEDGSLDFVYIDGAHDYDNVKADLEAWTPKVKVGGIVAGDDFYYFPSGKGGVQPAATEFTSNHQYNLRVTDWDPGNELQDERQPNFWFVKDHDGGPFHPHHKRGQ